MSVPTSKDENALCDARHKNCEHFVEDQKKSLGHFSEILTKSPSLAPMQPIVPVIHGAFCNGVTMQRPFQSGLLCVEFEKCMNSDCYLLHLHSAPLQRVHTFLKEQKTQNCYIANVKHIIAHGAARFLPFLQSCLQGLYYYGRQGNHPAILCFRIFRLDHMGRAWFPLCDVFLPVLNLKSSKECSSYVAFTEQEFIACLDSTNRRISPRADFLTILQNTF